MHDVELHAHCPLLHTCPAAHGLVGHVLGSTHTPDEVHICPAEHGTVGHVLGLAHTPDEVHTSPAAHPVLIHVGSVGGVVSGTQAVPLYILPQSQQQDAVDGGFVGNWAAPE